MSNYKSTSFIERKKNIKFKQKCTCYNPVVYEVIQEDKLDDKTQRIVRSSKLRESNAQLSHFKVSDFAMENLQAIGATLSPCQLSHDLNTNMIIAENALNKINTNIPETTE